MEPARVKAIYDEVVEYLIELDPDPISRGPGYLQENISRCRRMLNRVSLLLNEVSREDHGYQRDLRAEEAAYQAEFDHHLANDQRIRQMPNIEDRRSSINMLLRERLNRIDALKAQILDLSHVEKVIKHRHQELKGTMTDIRTQRSLLRDTLDTGQFYGAESEMNEGTGTGIGVDDENFEEVLRQQLGEIEAQPVVVEEASEPKSGPKASEKLEEGVEDPDIRKFLDGVENLDGIFDDL